MRLKDIAAIAGQPGLYRILKPTRTGMIVESIDAKPVKSVISATHRVSILKEISIYTTGEEDSRPLGDVLLAIKEKYGSNCKPGESGADLEDFLGTVLPDFDRARVYTSDIKKLVKWYNLLTTYSPSTFEAEEEVATKEQTEA